MTGIRRVSQLGTTGESTYVDGSIVNADIAAGAAIAVSKLAPSSSSGQVLMGGASGAPTYITPSGDVTWDQSGVVAIGTGVIVNADINASAAIAQSKIANLTSDFALKANLASPTFTGTLSASAITASGTVRGSGSIVQVVSNSQGASDLSSAGYIGTVTMTPKFADSTILVWVNYHAYKYNSTVAVNNYYQLRNITASTVIRENPYLTYGPPDYMFQGVISGVQAAGSTSSRQYGLLVDSSAAQRIYFYWSTTYAMEIAA